MTRLLGILSLASVLFLGSCRSDDGTIHPDLGELAPANLAGRNADGEVSYEPRSKDAGLEESPPPQIQPPSAATKAEATATASPRE